MKYPPVVVVDDADRPVGLSMLKDVWAQGLLHRIVRIMIEDGQGNILLQKRSSRMVIFPDCWDNSAAGHVDEGMTYKSAALQEAAEELGAQYHGLAEIGYYLSSDAYGDKRMNQFNKVYRIKFQGMPQTKDQHEVATFQWFSIAEAKRLVAEQPDKVTFGLRHVLDKLY